MVSAHACILKKSYQKSLSCFLQRNDGSFSFCSNHHHRCYLHSGFWPLAKRSPKSSPHESFCCVFFQQWINTIYRSAVMSENPISWQPTKQLWSVCCVLKTKSGEKMKSWKLHWVFFARRELQNKPGLFPGSMWCLWTHEWKNEEEKWAPVKQAAHLLESAIHNDSLPLFPWPTFEREFSAKAIHGNVEARVFLLGLWKKKGMYGKQHMQCSTLCSITKQAWRSTLVKLQDWGTDTPSFQPFDIQNSTCKFPEKKYLLIFFITCTLDLLCAGGKTSQKNLSVFLPLCNSFLVS